MSHPQRKRLLLRWRGTKWHYTKRNLEYIIQYIIFSIFLINVKKHNKQQPVFILFENINASMRNKQVNRLLKLVATNMYVCEYRIQFGNNDMCVKHVQLTLILVDLSYIYHIFVM